jgi:hypothetical protein
VLSHQKMKVAKTICLLLLFINGLGAFFGSIPLIKDPSGISSGLQLSWLTKPFVSYFIPGLALLILNGLGSLFVIITTLINKPYYPAFIIVQGAVLILWIIVELIFFNELSFFQPTMLVFGVSLVLLGYFIQSKSRILK